MKTKIPIFLHCFIIPIIIIQKFYLENSEFIDFIDVLIIGTVFVGITILLLIIVKHFLKNDLKSSIIVSFSYLIFFSYSPIYNILDDIYFRDFYIRHQYLLISFGVIFIGGIYYLIKFYKPNIHINSGINYFLIALIFVLVVINFIPSDSTDMPNIYYIILDSYPHSSILNSVFNYDDKQFQQNLTKSDFFIASNSHSNYNQSFLSLGASLNMKYLNYLSIELDENERNFHPVYELVDNNEVMKYFKSKGYEIVNFASRDGVTGNLEIAQINLCEINPWIKSPSMIHLIRHSIINPIYVEIFNSYSNEREMCVFSQLSQFDENSKNPYFIFAHILLPHGPWRFDANGQSLPEPFTYGDSIEDMKNKEFDQIIFVENEIKKVIKKIKKNDMNAIIIIQSDTGTSLPIDDKNEIIKRKTKILNAYYLPDGGKKELYENITPVNTFRIILNYYFNEKMELLEDKIFFSEHGTELKLEDVSDKLMK
jgi:hypothetical protein